MGTWKLDMLVNRIKRIRNYTNKSKTCELNNYCMLLLYITITVNHWNLWYHLIHYSVVGTLVNILESWDISQLNDEHFNDIVLNVDEHMFMYISRQQIWLFVCFTVVALCHWLFTVLLNVNINDFSFVFFAIFKHSFFLYYFFILLFYCFI